MYSVDLLKRSMLQMTLCLFSKVQLMEHYVKLMLSVQLVIGFCVNQRD